LKRFRPSPAETTFYYSTCTVTAWLPIFQSDAYFQIIIESLKHCRAYKGLYILGYVIMPTHLHLVTSNREDALLTDIIRDFRSFTSRKIRERLEVDDRIGFLKILRESASNLPKQDYRLWADEYHPIALKSDKWLNQKMNYMHYNPVRKGFVEKPEHWKYSSARNWILEDDGLIQIDRDVLSGAK
jgi:putative transposase